MNSVGEIIGKHSVEDDRDQAPASHDAGKIVHAEHLDEVDRLAHDPLEIDESARAPLEQWERAEAYDPVHSASKLILSAATDKR